MPSESSTPRSRRSESLRVRVHAEEREGLRRLAESLDLKPSELLRRLVREAVTQGPDYFDDGLAELRTAHRELAAIGRNINQLARAANREEPIVAAELLPALEDAKSQVAAVGRVYRDAVERSRRRTAGVVKAGS